MKVIKRDGKIVDYDRSKINTYDKDGWLSG